MSVRARIGKLERCVGKSRCSVCHGRPQLLVAESDRVATPKPAPCSGCGSIDSMIIYTGVSRNPDDPLDDDEHGVQQVGLDSV